MSNIILSLGIEIKTIENMQVLLLTPKEPYKIVRLIANKVNHKNSLAVVKIAGEIKYTGGIILENVESTRDLLNSIPAEEQYDTIRKLRTVTPTTTREYYERVSLEEETREVYYHKNKEINTIITEVRNIVTSIADVKVLLNEEPLCEIANDFYSGQLVAIMEACDKKWFQGEDVVNDIDEEITILQLSKKIFKLINK